MKYVDICKQAARQCCREHTVFNDKKHKERVCDNCPRRRDFKDAEGKTRRGICWFILMDGLTDEIITRSPYAQAEKAILEDEDVSYPKEFLKWLRAYRRN